MPGLAVNGLFVIPNDFDLQTTAETGQGSWVTLKVHLPDKDYQGNNFFHKFKVVMWVNQEQNNKLQDMVKPGRFFMISGHMEAKVKENLGFDPAPQIKTRFDHFTLTKISKVE